MIIPALEGGVIAHELSHMLLEIKDWNKKSEEEADDLAISRGYSLEILEAREKFAKLF